MSIDQILTDPVSSRKRKQTFTTDRATKRAKFNNNNNNQNNKHKNKKLKSFSIQQNNKFQKKLNNLINNPTNKKKTFKSIGVCRELCIATKKLKWFSPTKIQISSIPHALLGKDIIALAETGSGKTGAFALPIIQSLLSSPIPYHSLIISPTRELALNIHQQFEDLGAAVGLKSIAIIGGVDRIQQAMKLQRKPHVIIGTPGRLLDHLINHRGFKLYNLKYLVLDEADRILQSEFAEAIQQIIKIIQKTKYEYQLKLISNNANANANDDDANSNVNIDSHNYQTLLFSATMTKKVSKLEKASLRVNNMIKISVSNKYRTVSTLNQYYLFIPAKHKLIYIVYLLNNIFVNKSIIVFTNTKRSCHHLSLVLHNLNLTVIPLHGEMTQYERMGALEKFRDGLKSILIATDVAARGLDIPNVKVIINYDLPIYSKDYIHRVGRTARAGKKGDALNIVTQYDVEIFQRIEQLINIKMNKYPNIDENKVMKNIERVLKADNIANMQIKEHKNEIKDKIRELNKRKLNKNKPRLQMINQNDDDDNKFVMDDVDYDDDDGNNRMIGPKQKKRNSQIRNNQKQLAKKKHFQRRGSRGRGRGRGRGRHRRGGLGRAQSFDSMKNYKKSWKF